MKNALMAIVACLTLTNGYAYELLGSYQSEGARSQNCTAHFECNAQTCDAFLYKGTDSRSLSFSELSATENNEKELKLQRVDKEVVETTYYGTQEVDMIRTALIKQKRDGSYKIKLSKKYLAWGEFFYDSVTCSSMQKLN